MRTAALLSLVVVVACPAPAPPPAPPPAEGEGEGSVGEGEGEGEGEGDVGEGEGEGDVGEGEGEGEGDEGEGEGAGEGDVDGFVMPVRDVCVGGYGDVDTIGVPSGLAEASGVVASPTTPGLLWLHNDSDNDVALVAVRAADARVLGRVRVPVSSTTPDVEDLAAAPCPAGEGDGLACLWLADVGDNNRVRADVAVYAVAEAVVDVDADFVDVDADLVWRYPLVLAEGPANIEAMVVLPDASGLVLWEKQNDNARVFGVAGPFASDAADVDVDAAVVARIRTPGTGSALRVITGADLHTSGTRMLLRTYEAVYEAVFDDAVDVDGLAAADFALVLDPLEAQGEAVAYDETGTGVLTISEQVSIAGFTVPNALHRAPCN